MLFFFSVELANVTCFSLCKWPQLTLIRIAHQLQNTHLEVQLQGSPNPNGWQASNRYLMELCSISMCLCWSWVLVLILWSGCDICGLALETMTGSGRQCRYATKTHAGLFPWVLALWGLLARLQKACEKEVSSQIHVDVPLKAWFSLWSMPSSSMWVTMCFRWYMMAGKNWSRC